MQRYLKSDKVSTYIQLSAIQKEIVDRSRRRRRLKVWASVGHGSLSLVDALEISFCPKACSYTNGHDLGDDVGGDSLHFGSEHTVSYILDPAKEQAYSSMAEWRKSMLLRSFVEQRLLTYCYVEELGWMRMTEPKRQWEATTRR